MKKTLILLVVFLFTALILFAAGEQEEAKRRLSH